MMDAEKAREFLASVLGEEQAEKALADQAQTREQQIADAQIFFDVFGTGRGPEMLELLKHKTIYVSSADPSACVHDLAISLNPGEFMAGREMQNALIRWIERMVKLAQERPE